MTLSTLTVQNIRCIEHAEIALHPGRNLVWGGNGEGKTSLLESMFLLGRGRSFRTRNSERLVRDGAQRLLVFGRTAGGVEHAVGVEVDRQQGTRARMDGTSVSSLAELSRAFPVQVIDPEIHKLIEDGGRRRRRWLDWAVFHVEPRFAGWWLRYTRAVRQRNAVLRQGGRDTRPWDRELMEAGESISQTRQSVLDQMRPYWLETIVALDCPQAELQYFRGWSAPLSLLQALEGARARDEARRLTSVGPHRADVLIRVGGRPAREVLSRGQQKLMAVALTLAELRLLRNLSGLIPTLLLDDPAAELDTSHLAGFVGEIAELGCQLVITSLQPETLAFGAPDRVFHVERGRVRPV